MTAKSLLTALLPLVADLSRELPEGERYRRLLEAMRAFREFAGQVSDQWQQGGEQGFCSHSDSV